MTASISDLLSQIDAPGTFATRVGADAEDLKIAVMGAGPLPFPITRSSAGRLRAVARPSPFGLGEQTIHDPRVRNTWEVAASRVKIAGRRWKAALATHLQTIAADLGVGELEAVLDKLLLYEAGQFFKPHQDSEKDDAMVATLVVILPSAYSGGAVTVEHRGEKKVFRRVAAQAKDLSLLAFYADCHHAVSPIKSGVRVALTYQLRLKGRSRRARPSVGTETVDRLASGVRQHFATRIEGNGGAAPSARLVVLLDHEYTERSLSWTRLKNGDRTRVEALRAVAERLDCECYLALAEVHESWSTEPVYSGWGYPLACSCAECKVLSRFLRSSQVELDWPLNEERRNHVHYRIDDAKLPVRHTTLRKGRPHVLQLRKDRSLFARERAYRGRVQALAKALLDNT